MLWLASARLCGYDVVMEDLQWETPPAARGERTAYFKRLADRLMERPGAWAMVQGGLNDYRTQAAVLASRINSGTLTAFRPAGEFEATASKDKETGDNRVFARYIGPDGIYRDAQETSQEAATESN